MSKYDKKFQSAYDEAYEEEIRKLAVEQAQKDFKKEQKEKRPSGRRKVYHDDDDAGGICGPSWHYEEDTQYDWEYGL